jgi:flagellar hook-length control protein FliK
MPSGKFRELLEERKLSGLQKTVSHVDAKPAVENAFKATQPGAPGRPFIAAASFKAGLPHQQDEAGNQARPESDELPETQSGIAWHASVLPIEQSQLTTRLEGSISVLSTMKEAVANAVADEKAEDISIPSRPISDHDVQSQAESGVVSHSAIHTVFAAPALQEKSILERKSQFGSVEYSGKIDNQASSHGFVSNNLHFSMAGSIPPTVAENSVHGVLGGQGSSYENLKTASEPPFETASVMLRLPTWTGAEPVQREMLAPKSGSTALNVPIETACQSTIVLGPKWSDQIEPRSISALAQSDLPGAATFKRVAVPAPPAPRAHVLMQHVRGAGDIDTLPDSVAIPVSQTSGKDRLVLEADVRSARVGKTVDTLLPLPDQQQAANQVPVRTDVGQSMPLTPNAQSVLSEAGKLAIELAQPQSYQTEIEEVAAEINGRMKSVRIKLQPENLGMVIVNLHAQQEKMRIEVRVQNDEAGRALLPEIDAIAAALSGFGMAIDQFTLIAPGGGITVMQAAADRTGSGPAPNHGGQFQERPAGGNGERHSGRRDIERDDQKKLHGRDIYI